MVISNKQATGSKTAIYNVEEHGDPNVELPTSDVEPQYLIKWQNWSHIHNTWESRESLIAQRVKGMKKFDNYLARSQAAQAVTNTQSPEDAEYLACQAELYDSLVDTHALCERIIASQGADYLCKWQGLPYSDCTWEDGELVRKRFTDLVSEFEKRQQAQTYPPVSVKTQRVVRIRPRFVALKEKPAYLGADLSLELRDYQLDGLNWLANSWCKYV
jgi:chromodomain-helicase-DNA-binding protein 1